MDRYSKGNRLFPVGSVEPILFFPFFSPLRSYYMGKIQKKQKMTPMETEPQIYKNLFLIVFVYPVLQVIQYNFFLNLIVNLVSHPIIFLELLFLEIKRCV